MLELILNRIFGLDDTLAAAHPLQGVRQAMVGLRANDDIDGGRTAKDFLAFRLRNAAGNADHEFATLLFARFFHVAQAAERRVDLFSRLFADMTGVQQNQIRLAHILRLNIAVLRQRIAHTDGIVDVHLTAVGLDEDLSAVRTLAGNHGWGVEAKRFLGHGGYLVFFTARLNRKMPEKLRSR